MRIEYQKHLIRNATPADAELLCSWWNDGAVMAHAGFPNGLNITPEKVVAGLATDSDDTYRRLIIEVTDTPVGEMSYRNMGGDTAQIGIKICHFDSQEKGHGTIFLKMLINSLFIDYGYQKIILDTNMKNTRAQHVYEKLGFRKVRVNEDSWKNQLGKLQTSIDYELAPGHFVPLDQ